MSKRSDRDYLNVVLRIVLEEAANAQTNLHSEAAREHIVKRINEFLDR